MELTEEQIKQKIAEQCLLFTRNTILPYEKEWNCISFGSNAIKRKI